MHKARGLIFTLIAIAVLAVDIKDVLAQTTQTSESALYIPLIGITAVPDPLALPQGVGEVNYHYAVKTFLPELPLTNIQVVDDQCADITFVEGDDNNNATLDFSETWRYECRTKLLETTSSTTTVTGTAHGISATHKAYTTVVVGSDDPAPQVSIVNITKVAYPLSLPVEGGNITFTYKVNNPGALPLSDVRVSDDKCVAMSGKLGDTNANNLLDTNEVWIYTCTMNLKETTTNTATVSAFANNLKATANTTITVTVVSPYLPEAGPTPGLPNAQAPVSTFPNTGITSNFLIFFWAILAGILAGLTTFWVLKIDKKKK